MTWKHACEHYVKLSVYHIDKKFCVHKILRVYLFGLQW